MASKSFLSIVVFAVCVSLPAAAFANLWVNFYSADAGDYTRTSPYSGAIVDNFFDLVPPAGWTYTGDGAIVSGDSTDYYARPFNTFADVPDPTSYYVVPGPAGGASGSTRVEFGADYSILGLFWGSIDTYNSIAFYRDGALITTVTGSQVAGDPRGSWTAPGDNTYVNIGGLGTFDAVVFTSSQRAFEFDNLAVAVPVPAAVLIGMLGLGVAGLKLRKFV